jgi:hypothetical protein
MRCIGRGKGAGIALCRDSDERWSHVGNFDDATRDHEIVCPGCGAADVPGASPTLERQGDGHLLCSVCSRLFYPTSYAYRMSQHQLADDEKKKED